MDKIAYGNTPMKSTLKSVMKTLMPSRAAAVIVPSLLAGAGTYAAHKYLAPVADNILDKHLGKRGKRLRDVPAWKTALAAALATGGASYLQFKPSEANKDTPKWNDIDGSWVEDYFQKNSFDTSDNDAALGMDLSPQLWNDEMLGIRATTKAINQAGQVGLLNKKQQNFMNIGIARAAGDSKQAGLYSMKDLSNGIEQTLKKDTNFGKLLPYATRAAEGFLVAKTFAPMLGLDDTQTNWAAGATATLNMLNNNKMIRSIF